MTDSTDITKDRKARKPYSTERERLKALQVGRISAPGLYHDGGGLYLKVGPTGTKFWMFKYRLNDRVREMGLGSMNDFTLAEARDRARSQRQLLADKRDPIDERNANNTKIKAQLAQEISFEECARAYHAQESSHWKNVKHRNQWINTLRDYVFPKLGRQKVHMISREEIIEVLEPIWKVKPETASRVLQRMRKVFEWAAAKGHISVYEHGMWDLVVDADRKLTHL